MSDPPTPWVGMMPAIDAAVHSPAEPREAAPAATLAGPATAVTVHDDLAARWAQNGGVSAGVTQGSVLPIVEQIGDTFLLRATEGPRYDGQQPLGSGGMGEVELAIDRDIGRPVAIKRLHADQVEPGLMARFAEEVRIIGRLEHPNIVPIHDVGVDADGRYFFVMKFVDGETLESILDRLRRGESEAHARFSLQRRVEIFIGILRALDFAHQQGVIHRDLKPANVMVGPHGEVMLMDWGVARRIDPERRPPDLSLAASPPPPEAIGPATNPERAWQTQHGAVVGTPQYMAPEQALGHNDRLDARADLYAACVLFYELLGLRSLHGHHRTVAAVLIAVARAEAPSAMGMFPSHPAQAWRVPAEYAHLIHRGLQHAIEDRWQTATALIAELEAIGRGECQVQCPVTLARRVLTLFNRFLDRHGILAAVLINLAVLSLLVLPALVALWALR